MCYNPLFEGDWIDVAGGKGGLINPLQIRPVPPDTDDENAEPQENDSIGDLAIHLKTLQTFFRLYIPSMDDRLRALLDQALVELYHKFGISWDNKNLEEWVANGGVAVKCKNNINHKGLIGPIWQGLIIANDTSSELIRNSLSEIAYEAAESSDEEWEL